MTTARIDRLIERICQNKHNVDVWQDIVDEIYNGAPPLKLRPLFKSQDVAVVRHATWVASEIGAASGEIIDDCLSLLNSADGSTRFWALDIALLNATSADICIILRGVECIWDEESGNSWKALWFLCRLPFDVISLASQSRQGTNRTLQLLRAVIKQIQLSDMSSLALALNSDKFEERAAAAIVCARLQSEFISCLRAASDKSGDAIARFAADCYEDFERSRNLN